MNDRLVDAIRLIKVTYTNNFKLNMVHGIDKTELFLYLFHRWSIINHKDSIPVEYIYTMNSKDGSLLLYIDDLSRENARATWDMMKYGDDIDTFKYLDKYDREAIQRIVLQYILYDYDSMLSEMCSPNSNLVSPELIDFLPFPFTITEEILKERLTK